MSEILSATVSPPPTPAQIQASDTSIPMWVKAVVGAVIVIIVASVWLWITSPLQVTVTGTGSVDVPATSATFTVTVANIDANVTNAVTSMQNKVKVVEQQLTAHNIPSSAITESEPQIIPAAAVVAGAQGYQAAEALTVKSTDVQGVSGLITVLYNAGATLVSQPTVSVENEDALQQQAVTAALAQARTQEETIASNMHKFFHQEAGIQIVSSGSTATGTQSQGTNPNSGAAGTFAMVKTVLVTYKMW